LRIKALRQAVGNALQFRAESFKGRHAGEEALLQAIWIIAPAVGIGLFLHIRLHLVILVWLRLVFEISSLSS
jgi:hypothetical protein